MATSRRDDDVLQHQLEIEAQGVRGRLIEAALARLASPGTTLEERVSEVADLRCLLRPVNSAGRVAELKNASGSHEQRLSLAIERAQLITGAESADIALLLNELCDRLSQKQ